nr:hypothetical protein [Candidatus Sigynarchaeota archaeon]
MSTPKTRGFDHDPIEDDPAFNDRIKAAEKEASRLLKRSKRIKEGQLGYCHAFWGAKKRILREKYGIEWKSPAELNPYTKFD